MILSFWANKPWQTAETQNRQLSEGQSDQGLHYLLVHLHLLDKFLYGKTSLNCRATTTNILGVQKSRTNTVCRCPGFTNEPRHKKTCLRGFQPGHTGL